MRSHAENRRRMAKLVAGRRRGNLCANWSGVGVEWRRDDAYIWRRLRRIGELRENSPLPRRDRLSSLSCNIRAVVC